MSKRSASIAGVVSLVVSASIGLASPAAAATEWEMPDVEGQILQSAWDAVLATSEGAVVPATSSADGMPYEQINLTNWVVCAQSPSEGGTFSAEEPPELEVARFNQC
ncbi:hypothetical protein E4P42_12600 [Mycobacterium sp. PS03-16]|uniref:hypothetical protein n=1 Tax=Mycobacterium sp. PS03-16 TaxID=2559611 RepID=UPI0010733FA9|nr:hypothetical protein [Mycobacterium sp. PS03-16]TFV58203.1 hypothetical protein E4P42_12600 [Mycobacterium sp. PS03-16]